MPRSSKTQRSRYRKDIDGIRALAILPVVVFHAFPGVLPGGFVGVDIFFVISGYLISSHIFQELQADSFSLLTFYVKRIRRIYPALITVLGTCLLIGWFGLLSSEYAELGRLTAAGAAFLSNIVLWKTSNYFATKANDNVLLHLWSLGVEEQYYIVWPLLLLLARRSRKLIAALVVFGTIGSFGMCVVLTHLRPTASFYLPFTRFWELLIGVILAYCEIYGAPEGKEEDQPWISYSETASVAGLACILISLFELDRNGAFPGYLALLPTAGTFLLIAAGGKAWINRQILSHPLLVFIGLISYPLYLWHWPLLVFTRIFSGGTPASSSLAAAVALSFVLAWLTYRLIEMPLRFGNVFGFPRRAIARGLFAVMVAVGATGWAISRNEARLGARFAGAGDTFSIQGLQEVAPACKARFPFATDFCRLSQEDKAPTVVLLGDSHAIHFYSAMAARFGERNENLLVLAEGDCPPFYDVNVVVANQPKKCPKLNNKALDYAVQTDSVRRVVLSAFSAFDVTGYNFQDESGDRKVLQDTTDTSAHGNPKIFQQGLRRTVSRLAAAKKRVYVILDNPEINFDPSSCVVHRPLSFIPGGIRIPCGLPRSVVNTRQNETRALIEQAVAGVPGVTLLDPLAVLCDAQHCLAAANGISYYMDRNHLSPQGAAKLVEAFRW